MALTLADIDTIQRIGRGLEGVNSTTIGLAELDALCDLAREALRAPINRDSFYQAAAQLSAERDLDALLEKLSRPPARAFGHLEVREIDAAIRVMAPILRDVIRRFDKEEDVALCIAPERLMDREVWHRTIGRALQNQVQGLSGRLAFEAMGFVACSMCAERRGDTRDLCTACFANRTTIERLRELANDAATLGCRLARVLHPSPNDEQTIKALPSMVAAINEIAAKVSP